MPAPTGPGRPRRYCRRSCKQRDYEARRRSRELGLGEHELVVTREMLAEALDHRFLLACALDDVERDLAAGDLEPAAALDVLVAAVREAVGAPPEPTPSDGEESGE